MRIDKLCGIFLTVLLLVGCGVDYGKLAQQREDYASKNQGDIVVAAVYDKSVPSYLKGIQLAADEINARPGKLLGRQVRIVEKIGKETFREENSTIEALAADPEIVAVLGHRLPEIVIPASVIYEASHILFLPPATTIKSLTGHNFKYIFRMLPNTKRMTAQMANVAELLGYKRLVMLYAQDDISRESAFLLEDAVIERKMKLIHRRSYQIKDSDFRGLISQFVNDPFDAILLASPAEPAARLVLQLREMGIKVPIIGTDKINDVVYDRVVGAAGDNTIVPTLYKRASSTRINQDFIARYQRSHDDEFPDYNAAQGYDGLMMLCVAIEMAKSTMPNLIASTLHYLPVWFGVSGSHSFDQSGNDQMKKFFFKVMQNNQWYPLPLIHVPYYLERAEAPVAQQRRKSGLEPFSKMFNKKMHPDDLKTAQLDFIQEMLNFQKLAIIYPVTTAENMPSYLENFQTLAKKKGFSLQTCGIKSSEPDHTVIKQSLIKCFGRLAMYSDALFMDGLSNLNKEDIKYALSPLVKYHLPVFTFDENIDATAGIVVKLSKPGDQVQAKDFVETYAGILRGIKVHELADSFENLPILSVNYDLMTTFGLLSPNVDAPIQLYSPEDILN